MVVWAQAYAFIIPLLLVSSFMSFIWTIWLVGLIVQNYVLYVIVRHYVKDFGFLYVETKVYYMVCDVIYPVLYISIWVWFLSPWLNFIYVYVSCWSSCWIPIVLRHLAPICCAFVFKCKLLVCTHVGGVPLCFAIMLVSIVILLQIRILSSNTKKGEIERTSLTICFVCLMSMYVIH